jgi:hypothetical protein
MLKIHENTVDATDGPQPVFRIRIDFMRIWIQLFR